MPRTRGRGARPVSARKEGNEDIAQGRGRGRDRDRRRMIPQDSSGDHVLEMEEDDEVIGEVVYEAQTSRHNSGDTIQNFLKLQPPSYEGEEDFFKAERWLETMEEYFRLLRCQDENKTMYATHMLKDTAVDWWRTIKATQYATIDTIPWRWFKEAFQSRYAPTYMREEKQKDFLCLQQGNMSVAAYHTKYIQLEKYGDIHMSDEKRAERFIDGLTPMLRSRAMLGTCPNLEKAVKLATKIEKDLQERSAEMRKEGGSMVTSQRRPQLQWGKIDGRDRDRPYPLTERRPLQVLHGLQQQHQHQPTRILPSPLPQERTPRQDRPLCNICGRYHGGVCWKKKSACGHCGQVGHYVRECPGLNKGKQAIQDKAKEAQPPNMVQGKVYNTQAEASTPDYDIIGGGLTQLVEKKNKRREKEEEFYN